MENRQAYYNLMKPLVIRGKVLKNRLEASNSLPHFLQGPETYPADTVIAHYENKARSAAIVTCMGINNQTAGKQMPMFLDFGHFPDYNLYDPCCQNYLMQMADAIHYHQSLACMALFAGPPSQYPIMRYSKKDGYSHLDDVDEKKEGMINAGPPMDEYTIEYIPAHLDPTEYTPEQLSLIADSLAEQAYLLSKLDFDMVSIHMCYRGTAMAMFFSPLTNRRTDEFGGDYDGRKKFPLMVLERIRERVGNKMIIEVQWTGDESVLGGYGLDESVSFLNEAKQYVDIVQLRGYEADPSHPTGFNPEETPFADEAAYIKARCPGLLISTVGGNFYPDTCEKLLADGKADIIAAARAYISNPDYGQLIRENRADDIVPCLRCNKCHGRGPDDPFQSICSVNPVIGLEQKIERMKKPVTKQKKVAVIGGGPAGMRCAIFLSDRGHTPIIFEKSDSLGGAVKHADYADFKWPLRDYKNYLIHQMDKRKIEVRLNTAASPEQIAAEGFDAVVTALGAVPAIPPVDGLDTITPVFYEQAFADPDSLGENVVIIGGGEVGVEIGIHLARKGHRACVLEMRDRIAADATMIHYLSMMKEAWEKEKNFSSIVNARVKSVSPDTVTYIDKDGIKQTISADSIVLSCGMKPRNDEALSFYGSAPEFYMIGDCSGPATIQQATRAAYGVANSI